ncbi:hypothetical protein [uncultured Bradyrhizobium sp.]|jgi:hypothetical protein|uniref:hypothetical protein n=1 Tax=uncultured Bradyrhizobium sp. TaxID=199684 RepID=UPI00261FBDA8|nr:hypothetical protein [uncultured Bradyrhizobium sp.]
MNIRKEFLRELLNDGAQVFAASGNADGSQLTLHITAATNQEQLQARISATLSRTSAKIRVSVRSHKLRRLAFPRSLEHLLRPFSSEGILYDPTMIVARARDLQRVAQSCRATLGKHVAGIFCDSLSRRVFVLVRGPGLADHQLKIARMMALRHDASSDVDISSLGWEGAIQVVAALPNQRLVPVDARSAGVLTRVLSVVRRWRVPGTVALAISAAASAPAAAHTNARQLLQNSASVSVQADRDYGVLNTLTVFADGARLGESAPFIASGLRMYFGEKQQLALNMKQKFKRRGPAEEELGQAGPGGPGGGGGTGGGGAGGGGAGGGGAGGGGAGGGGGGGGGGGTAGGGGVAGPGS